MEFFRNRLAHLMGILLPLAFVLAATAAPVAPSRTPMTFHAFPAAIGQAACEPPVRLPVATSYNTSTAYDAGQIYFVAAESATPFQQIMGNLRRRGFSAVPNTALFYSGTGGIAEAGVEGVLKGEAAGAAADASAAKALQEQAAALERLVGHGGGLADITGSEQGVETAGRESVVAAKAAESAAVNDPLNWSVVKKSTGETRWEHIQLHSVNDLGNPLHGVFDHDPVLTVQEAWQRVQSQGIKPTLENGADVYRVPMGRRVGWEGGSQGSGKAIKDVVIVTKPGTAKIVTAYPQ